MRGNVGLLDIFKRKKSDDLDDLEVVERVPLQVGSDPENIAYLEAKKIVKGHFFS